MGKTARVFHTTLGSGADLENVGRRRMMINAVYWGMGMEAAINPTRSIEIVGAYKPLGTGFNYQELGVAPKPPAAYK